MRVFSGEIRLFRTFGVSIYLDYSWFIFFFLVVWTFGRVYFRIQDPGFGPILAWVLGVAAAILLFASVIFHELSHALVSNRLGAHLDPSPVVPWASAITGQPSSGASAVG